MSTKTDKKSSSPKTESKKSDSAAKSTDTAAKSTDTAPTSEKKTKASGTARSISYFSSVATDDYRDGWDGIFTSNPEQVVARKTGRTKPKAKGPVVIELDAEELDDDLRAQLEAAFRAKAKKKRIAYDKRAQSGQVSWQLTCKLAS